MKSTILGALAVTHAVRIAPDVFGPNGDNYKNDDTAQDMAKIKIDISAPGSGSFCKDTDEATIHYSAYTTDGRIFSDSKQDPEIRRPTSQVDQDAGGIHFVLPNLRMF